MSNNKKSKGNYTIISILAIVLAVVLIVGLVLSLGNHYGGWFESETSVDSSDSTNSTDDSSGEEEVVYSRNILTWEGSANVFIAPASGSVVESDTYCTTDYIAVTGGKYLVFSKYGTLTAMRFVAVFDENKKIIAHDNTAYSNLSSVLLEDEAAYVRVTLKQSMVDVAGYQLELSDDGTCTGYVAYGPVTADSETGTTLTADGSSVYTSSSLYGKNVAWIGTSITNGYTWCSLVNRAFGFEATNCGVSGTAMCYEGVSSMCNTERLLGTYSYTTDEDTGEITYTGKAIPEDVEIVFIEAGTNDWARNWELGERQITYDDDYNIDLDIYTFYGACHQFFENVTELFPNATVIAVGAPFGKLANRSAFENKYGLINNQGLTTLDYGDALVDVAGMWGFYGINMGRYMGINDNNIEEYIPDGLHLTTTYAQESACNVICNYLLQIESAIA